MDTNKTGNHKQENQRDQVREQVINDYIENLRKYNGYTEKVRIIPFWGSLWHARPILVRYVC